MVQPTERWWDCGEDYEMVHPLGKWKVDREDLYSVRNWETNLALGKEHP